MPISGLGELQCHWGQREENYNTTEKNTNITENYKQNTNIEENNNATKDNGNIEEPNTSNNSKETWMWKLSKKTKVSCWCQQSWEGSDEEMRKDFSK